MLYITLSRAVPSRRGGHHGVPQFEQASVAHRRLQIAEMFQPERFEPDAVSLEIH